MIIAGFGIPAQRAYIMVSLMFVGLIFYRKAISMRLVAWAAIVVVLLNPASVSGPSFQLSFMAVIALIALHSAWKAREILPPKGISNRVLRAIDAARAGMLASMAISLVAAMATVPVTLYYFGQFSLLGVLANFIAVPLMGLWVMPIRLEAPFFVLMGVGIDFITSYAQFLAKFPLASLKTTSISSVSMVIGVIGVLWVSLLQGRVRYLGFWPQSL
ncbi:MAG: ComEC/Rec2 family competence protein [Pseudomonadota bacterium]